MPFQLGEPEQPPKPAQWAGQSLASYAVSHEAAQASAYYSPSRPNPADSVRLKRSHSRRKKLLATLVGLVLIAAIGAGAWLIHSRQVLETEYEAAWADYEATEGSLHSALLDANAVAEQCRVVTQDESTCDNLDEAIISAERTFPVLTKTSPSRTAIDEVKDAVAIGREAIATLDEATASIENTIRDEIAEELRQALIKARVTRAEISDILEWDMSVYDTRSTNNVGNEANSLSESGTAARQLQAEVNSLSSDVSRLDRQIDQASQMLEGGADIGITTVETPSQYGAGTSTDEQRPVVHVDEDSGKPAKLTADASLAEARDIARVMAELAEELSEKGEELRTLRERAIVQMQELREQEQAQARDEEETARTEPARQQPTGEQTHNGLDTGTETTNDDEAENTTSESPTPEPIPTSS